MTQRRPLLALAGLVVAFAAGAAGCRQDTIEVRPAENGDYNHTALLHAVDKFVAAGRTPAAYAELSRTVLALRPGMDRAVAREAELKLLVLALAPVQAVQARAMTEQVDTLALTVWPTLLAPEIAADDLLTRRDPAAAAYTPQPSEDARAYLIRLCGGPLAGECKQVVPELQGAVVAAVADRRATERVRNAVSDCVMCGADPAWHQAVHRWEELDRMAASTVSEVRRRADPDNWPVAGAAAETDPHLPEAEIAPGGEVVIGGAHYGAEQRVAALRDLRGTGTALALHLRPETSLAQVRGVLGDARKAGATRVVVIARVPRYPWERKAYRIVDAGARDAGAGYRAGLRPTDSLQLLLHATDEVAGPGAVARVD